MVAANLSRTIVTAAFALGVAAAWPAAAAADQPPMITTVTASKVVHGPTGSIGSATAHCPRGTRVISGGYDSTFRAGALLPFASMRSGPRTWRVSAYRVGGGGGNLKLTTYAKCGDHLSPLTRVSETTSVPSLSGNVALRTLRPRCPGGDFALSGGFKITVNGRSNPNSPPVAVIFGSRAAGHAWAVTAVRLASGESQLTAIAYCAAGRPFKRGISGVFPATKRPRPQRLTALCPRGMSAASGGFLAHYPMGAARGAMIPVTSHPAGLRRWTSTGAPQNANSFFSAYAYCI